MNGRLSCKLPFAAVLALAGLFSGCARYQYTLVEPGGHRQAIAGAGAVVAQTPLEYQWAGRDSRLALRIMNPSADPVRLVGEKSYVVDPTGATHPLPGGTIAPKGHVGLTLPPAPLLYRSSPRFSFGLGFGSGFGPWHGGPYHSLGWGYDYPFFYEPTDFYAVNPPNYWEWNTGEVRMRLVYEGKNTNSFEHNFTLDRQRVK